jgi:hypothetical protein
MKEVGLHLVYSPPIVRHDRSAHDYLADFQAESDLYLKTNKLLQCLDEWKSDAPDSSLVDRIYELWIHLYEHEYIELEDVEAVKEWLSALSQIGYEFPSPPKQLQKGGGAPNDTGDDGIVTRAQPAVEGQPYRSRPYFNMNHQGKTYAQMDEHTVQSWNEWNKTVDLDTRPQHSIIKLILMTMDEWPLIQTWTLVSEHEIDYSHWVLIGFAHPFANCSC